MEIGTVQQVDIDQEMQVAYLDYAMSVIVSRALPDVRDGLKPVHRRILYAMHDMGLHPNSPYRKSARIVGEVLGKYHPHGDAAVYESMVRMAQDFSMRYTLVDGQGNFGSVDGDSAAAMRYTEARLEALAEELLSDIQKQTVDFGPNFDGSLHEPLVLPAAFPNLIVNGSAGIAVGMATNIPPHNLGEVCDAITYLIDHYKRVEEISVDELMQFIKGPDFPTGGIVYTANGDRSNGDDVEDYLVNAYATGRGRITVQAKAHIEEMSRNRNRIVVTELPYQVNKSRLIERIAELVRDGKLEGITDLRDESDRQGMRMVIELTRNVEPRQLLSRLYRLTPMRSTFSIMMLALVDGEPRTLSLRRLLHHFVEHRREIVTRRSEFDLARARERAHILEGLLVALFNLDEVIQIIRRSRTAETAHTNLCKRFKLTDIQAQAILDMPLRRLAALERQKIEEEYREKLKLIAYLEDLLAHPAKILNVIKEELAVLKKKYGDARRTQIMRGASAEVLPTGIVPDEMGIVIVERSGRIRREPENRCNTFAIGQGGQVPDHVVLANARDTLVCLTQEGRALPLPAHHVPYTESPEVKTLGDLTSLKKSTELAYVLTLPSLDSDDAPDEGYLVTLTAAGKIKRSNLADVRRALARGDALLMNVDQGDQLLWAVITPGGRELILVTSQGKAIRFGEEEVRPTGLGAGGVLAMKIDPDDRVVGAGLVSDARLLTVSENGYGKLSTLTEYPAQKRYGAGIVAARLSPRTGLLATAAVVDSDARIILHTMKGSARRYKATDFPIMGRSSLGRPAEGISSKDPIVGAVFLVGAPDDHPEVAGGKPSPTAPPKSRQAGTRRKAPTARPSEAKKRGTGRSPERRGSTAKKKTKREPESEAAPRAETDTPRQAELELTIELPRMKTTPTRRPSVTQRPAADEEIDLPVKSRTARRGTAKTVASTATSGRTAPRTDRPKADEELDIPVKHRPVRKGTAGPRRGPAVAADDELDLPLTKRRAVPKRHQHAAAEDELDLPPAARKPSGKQPHRTDTTKPK